MASKGKYFIVRKTNKKNNKCKSIGIVKEKHGILVLFNEYERNVSLDRWIL